MTTYLGQSNFEPAYSKTARVNDISQKWEKWYIV